MNCVSLERGGDDLLFPVWAVNPFPFVGHEILQVAMLNQYLYIPLQDVTVVSVVTLSIVILIILVNVGTHRCTIRF